MNERDIWLARCNTALKGQAFDADAALQGRIVGERAFRPTHAPWKILQRIDHADDAAKALAQAEDDLANGADGLVLTSVEVAGVLSKLPVHKTMLRNEAGDSGAEAIRMAVGGLPLDPARLAIDFGIQDPDLAQVIHGAGFTGPLMKSDGTKFHAEGADHATELGCILAETLGRWRVLDFLDDASLARSVSMKLIASQDMFGTMAKFRAARILWAELLSAVGLPAADLALHGETSRLMLADIDPHTNILRSVTAVFGAGLGGADSFCVLPFSFNQGLPNSFARRVSRNVQSLLINESQLWRVDDAAGGAGVIENLTDRTCEEAWAVMQRCERGEWPKADVQDSSAQPIIGVSKYQNAVEPSPEIETAA